MFIFLEMIYSQNDETGIFEVLQIISFTAQPWWTDLLNNFLKNFLKIFSVDFTLW